MHDSPVERILLSEGAIRDRVAELGAAVSRDYAGRELVMLAVLRGAAIFAADLSRAVATPHLLDFVGLESYGHATHSSGRVRLTTAMPEHAAQRHVLIVEDIFDSGRTLSWLIRELQPLAPLSVEVCTLLVKDRSRAERGVRVRYEGFHIPDEFVVGYGLDFAQRYRHLPYIGVLRRDLRDQ